MQGRCVWTDEHGDKVYSELKGEFVATGNHIVGTFLGGTGRYTGMTGEYSFQWKYIVESEDGTVSGRAVVTFIWLAVLFALSGQLNELGFMGYVGGRLTSLLAGITWPCCLRASPGALRLDALPVRQPVGADTGSVRRLPGGWTGVPAPLMAFSLLFASSYFSTTTHREEAKMSSSWGAVTSRNVSSTDLAC
jgi:hypothetical protein